MSARSWPRTLILVTFRSRPFASVRSRILGWSVLLLAAALTASTVAMHVFLVRHLDTRVNAELAHEIGEFHALEAQRAAGATPAARTGRPPLSSRCCGPGPVRRYWNGTRFSSG